MADTFNAADYFVDRHIREGRGENIAIECGDDRITYQELFENVNRCGNFLLGQGTKREDRILMMLADTPDFAYVFWGAIKIGAIPVPVNTLLQPADYEYFLKSSGARFLFIDKNVLPKFLAIPKENLPHLDNLFITGEDLRDSSFKQSMQESSVELAPAATGKDDPAFWLYSSGSTGLPKACVHLQHDMAVCSEHYAKGVLHISEHDRCFSVSKLFFAYGLGNALYYPFAVGATSILMPGSPKPEPIFQTIERYHPTLFFSVPSNYNALLAYADEAKKKFDLSSIRCAVSAGEALPAMLFERFKEKFGIELLDSIGSTEAAQAFIANRPGRVRPGSSGEIVPGYEAKILDDEGKPVAHGEIGNLFIKTEAAFAGYWEDPEKTKENLQGDWIKTGDKYSEDKDGYFWFAGRADDIFKSNGMWVSPVEVEAVLQEDSDVFEAAVVGKEDENNLVKPMAYVVLRAGSEAGAETEEKIKARAAKRLAPYKRPHWITFLPELPKTATGKIQRFKLR